MLLISDCSPQFPASAVVNNEGFFSGLMAPLRRIRTGTILVIHPPMSTLT